MTLIRFGVSRESDYSSPSLVALFPLTVIRLDELTVGLPILGSKWELDRHEIEHFNSADDGEIRNQSTAAVSVTGPDESAVMRKSPATGSAAKSGEIDVPQPASESLLGRDFGTPSTCSVNFSNRQSNKKLSRSKCSEDQLDASSIQS